MKHNSEVDSVEFLHEAFEETCINNPIKDVSHLVYQKGDCEVILGTGFYFYIGFSMKLTVIHLLSTSYLSYLPCTAGQNCRWPEGGLRGYELPEEHSRPRPRNALPYDADSHAWVADADAWISDSDAWISDSDARVSDSNTWISDPNAWVSDSRSWFTNAYSRIADPYRCRRTNASSWVSNSLAWFRNACFGWLARQPWWLFSPGKVGITPPSPRGCW